MKRTKLIAILVTFFAIVSVGETRSIIYHGKGVPKDNTGLIIMGICFNALLFWYAWYWWKKVYRETGRYF